MKPPEKLYIYNVKNLRAVSRALNHTARAGKHSIRLQQPAEVASFIRTYALLLGIEIEARLAKELHEPKGFDETAREKILSKQTTISAWLTAVEMGFRKQYKVPRKVLDIHSLPHDAFHRFKSINSIISETLTPIVSMRNKLAHGQWIYPLNDDKNDIVPEMHNILRKESILSLELKRNSPNMPLI